MDDKLTLLKEITEVAGPSGYESEVRAVIRKYLQQHAEISVDGLGSIICKKRGSADAPRIMLAGHMDEIGFMVKSITKDGYIRFQTLGGWWNQVMLAQRVIVKGKNGDVVGIIGSKPPHILKPEERKKVVEKDSMFIDVGAKSKEEAMEVFGIRPGDPIVPDASFTIMKSGKHLMSKAWDDRLGCALFIEVIRTLANENIDHPNTVFGVGTVQEEVGLRGATTSANVVKPDIGIALEVGIAGDMPGVSSDHANEKLGEGPVVLLYDASMIPHIGLRNFVEEVAKTEGIPLQFDSMAGGGTDAGRIHIFDRGVPSIVIAVPTRYIHSHYGIVHRDDYENCIKLLVALIKRLDANTVKELQYS